MKVSISLASTEGTTPNDVQLAEINRLSLIEFNPCEVQVYTATAVLESATAEHTKVIARLFPGRAVWAGREPVGRWFELLELSPTRRTLKGRFYLSNGRAAKLFSNAVRRGDLRWSATLIRDLTIDSAAVTNAWRRRMCA